MILAEWDRVDQRIQICSRILSDDDGAAGNPAARKDSGPTVSASICRQRAVQYPDQQFSNSSDADVAAVCILDPACGSAPIANIDQAM